MSLEEVVLARLASKAANGDLRATKLLYDLKDRYYCASERPAIVIQVAPEDLKV